MRRTFVLVMLAVAAATGSAPAAQAAPAGDEFCAELGRQQVVASTLLVLGKRERGVATAKSTLTMTVATGWTGSGTLLTDDPDPMRGCLGYTTAYRAQYQEH